MYGLRERQSYSMAFLPDIFPAKKQNVELKGRDFFYYGGSEKKARSSAWIKE